VQDLDEYRPELTAHCYRMLGSVHEAEDLVQETMVRAWRNLERYDERRASLRTWLYKIATNACLTALQGRARRPLPTGLGGPGDDPEIPLVPNWEIPWLEPIPDAMVDPAAQAVRRGTLRVALVAALQLLPPKQRAALVLREVLEFSAAEVADLLDTSTASVNSALQRARATLAGTSITDEDAEPDDAKVRDLVDRYVHAFERADVDALVALLTNDVILEMPPVPLWFDGRVDYGRFMRRVFTMRGTDWRVVPAAANGQPALAAYVRTEDGQYHMHTLNVLTVTPRGIAHNAVFADPAVHRTFGLPEVLA
jgi:RNA polymerase sigma-70 factor, ECF subfamily